VPEGEADLDGHASSHFSFSIISTTHSAIDAAGGTGTLRSTHLAFCHYTNAITTLPLQVAPVQAQVSKKETTVLLAVCGAHLKGYPLHWQITEGNGEFVEATTTAPSYRMFAFATGGIAKPGLIKDAEGMQKGGAIYLEIYRLSLSAFGKFVSNIPSPLGIGKVELANGTSVSGFIAEPEVMVMGEEITQLGDWRKYTAKPAVP
jgi:allophanate hydrolase